ncbi:MAG: hypothetical protein HFG56_07810, partial [Lachnospiraceae bacterium]|nr:hypothetical protein [Lachnospiraceae bacterium]
CNVIRRCNNKKVKGKISSNRRSSKNILERSGKGIAFIFQLIFSESEVSLMCNLSKGVEEKEIQKGIDKGITAMILTLKELQISSDVILKQICEKIGLTEETAETYLKEIC